MNDRELPIRVMFVAPCFGYGGLEQVIMNVIRNLDRSRFSPSFCTLFEPEADLYAELKALDLPCYFIEKGDGFNPSLSLKLRSLFMAERIELVNSHDIGATMYAASAARLAGIPAVIHTDHSQILDLGKYRAVFGWILKYLVNFSTTVSRDLEDHLIARYGMKPDLVRTIPNGIDTERFTSAGDTDGLRQELGINKGNRVIGTVGRLMRQKGIPYLLDAFRIVQERAQDTTLVIVGDGEERCDLEKLAHELGVRDKVVFAGIRRDIPELLAMFDVFTLASLWEGQPITIMEAMAAGRPIVATDAGGNAEILDKGKYGIVVPVKDPGAQAEAILAVLDDPQRAAALGERARTQAQAELSSVVMTRLYEEVFEFVCAGSRNIGRS